MNFQTDISKFIESTDKNCIKIQRKDFKKDEIITTYIGKRNQICILISGTADLVRYDSNGNKSIVQRFSSNDISGIIVDKNSLCGCIVNPQQAIDFSKLLGIIIK